MSENIGIIIITSFGIFAMIVITYLVSKIMINTTRYSRSKHH